jgi:undecaprenyl diphosphate synthase
VGLYDRYLAARVRLSDADVPERVALVITEHDLLERGAYDTLSSFLEWAFETDVERVLIYVSVLDQAAVPTLRNALSDLDSPRPVAVRSPEDDDAADAPVQVSIGLGGREEFAAAVRQIAEGAAEGDLDPAVYYERGQSGGTDGEAETDDPEATQRPFRKAQLLAIAEALDA